MKTAVNASAAKARECQCYAFTLVEAVVAMLVVGMAVISIFAGITASFDRVRSARQSARATQVMLDKLEGMRVLTWEQITSNKFLPRTFTAPYVKGVTNGQAFLGTFTVARLTNVNGSYASDLRQINVSVRANWGTRRTWNMTTYYGRNGIQTWLQPR